MSPEREDDSDVERPVKRARTTSRSVSPRTDVVQNSQTGAVAAAPLARDTATTEPPSSPTPTLEATTTDEQLDEQLTPERRVSYYVQALDELIDQVLKNEGYLFSLKELHALNRLKNGNCKCY